MPISLPRFERLSTLVDKDGQPTIEFHMWWQKFALTIESSFNTLETAVINIQAAQDAATAANTAAAAANTAAVNAQTSANTANTAATASTAATALQNSWVTGVTLGATDAGTSASISISAHTRNYSTGTTVSLNAGSITGLAYSTLYYIYYDDAARTGGTVTYVATVNTTTAAQTGNRHTVGSITTPAALGAPATGLNVRAPGVGAIQP